MADVERMLSRRADVRVVTVERPQPVCSVSANAMKDALHLILAALLRGARGLRAGDRRLRRVVVRDPFRGRGRGPSRHDGPESNAINERLMATLATQRIVERVDAERQRTRIPREGSLSLPIPSIERGRLHLAFFWASQGGPANARRMSAPYCRMSVDPSGPNLLVNCEWLDRGTLGIPGSAVPLSPRVGAGLQADERKALRARFDEMTDRVAARYGEHPVSPDVDPDGSLAAYREAFLALSVIALRPAYRALSPSFFDWVRLD